MTASIGRLRQILVKNKRCKSLVLNQKVYDYGDILGAWEKWKTELERKQIGKNSIVMVKSDLSLNSIGLMLAIIENNSIFVPISSNTKQISQYQNIAEVTDFFDLTKDYYNKIDKKPENPLIKGLLQESCSGLILFSSGTTGAPKAALHNFERLFQKFKEKGKSFVGIAFLLFDHIGGINTLFYSLFNAGCLVIPTKRSPETIMNLIQEHKVEVLPTTPSFINIILLSKAYESYKLDSLKVITYGTEPMSEATLLAFNKLFPKIKLKQTYGLSEVGILRSKSQGSDSLWMKLGDQDHQVEVRQGILWIKSRMSMLGYLNANSLFDKDGWFNTKDQVIVKGDYFKILGRSTDLINVGGEKVYPSEVENVIIGIENINDVIVQGESHPFLGQIVIAHISVDDSVSEKKELKRKIQSVCREKLEKYKRPLKIIFTEKSFLSNRYKKIRIGE